MIFQKTRCRKRVSEKINSWAHFTLPKPIHIIAFAVYSASISGHHVADDFGLQGLRNDTRSCPLRCKHISDTHNKITSGPLLETAPPSWTAPLVEAEQVYPTPLDDSSSESGITSCGSNIEPASSNEQHAAKQSLHLRSGDNCFRNGMESCSELTAATCRESEARAERLRTVIELVGQFQPPRARSHHGLCYGQRPLIENRQRQNKCFESS
jgi:hypothetical protein